MAVTQAQLTELYLSYFGRPPDFDGIQYYTSNPAFTMASVAGGFSASAESQALYGSTFGASQINAIYQNLFNRDAEPAGLTYWSQEVQAGRISAAGAALAIFQGAQGADRTAAANKIQIATAFVGQLDTNAEIIGYSGTAAAASARAFLRTVTDAAATVTTATSGLAAAVANAVGIGSTAPGANGGQTYTLTTAVDTLTGTGGNDLFVATSATTSPSFTASDTINGGNGTDTLNLTVDTNTANNVPAATATSVEIINVRNVSGNAQTIAAGNFTGATQINADRSTNQVDVTGLVAGQAVGIMGNGTVVTGALNATYGATVTAATLNVSGGTATGSGAVAFTGAALATVNINSSTAANTVGTIALGGAATALNVAANSNLTTGNITGFTGTAAKITVTGAATAANLGTLENTTVKTVDASAFLGALTVTANTNTTLVLTGGAGNDVITTGAVLATGGTIDGGAGTGDRLVVAASAHVDATAGKLYKGFEQVQVQDSQTVDVTQLATNNTIDTVRINAAAGATGATGLSAAQAAAVQVIQAGGGVITVGVTGATTGGQIDTVKIAATTTTAAGAAQAINLTGVTLTGVEKLEVTGNGTAAATTGAITLTTANATSLDSITVKNAAATTVTIAAGQTATNLVVDGSGSTGAVTVDASAYATATGATLKGGAGQDILHGSNQNDSLNGGAGNDVLTAQGGTATAGTATALGALTAITANTTSNTLTGGAGRDVFGLSVTTVANANSITDLDLGTGAAAGGVDAIYFDGATAAAAGTVTIATLSAATQTNVTAAASLAAAVDLVVANNTAVNVVTQFTYGADTYIFINGVAGGATYTAAEDLLVKVTGVTGTLDASDIVVI